MLGLIGAAIGTAVKGLGSRRMAKTARKARKAERRYRAAQLVRDRESMAQEHEVEGEKTTSNIISSGSAGSQKAKLLNKRLAATQGREKAGLEEGAAYEAKMSKYKAKLEKQQRKLGTAEDIAGLGFAVANGEDEKKKLKKTGGSD